MKRVAISFLLTAVVACSADQMLPPPTALIQDAGHNGGNQFFAFLQPMVSQPTTNGVFDPNLTPTVKVGIVPGSTCSDPNITYTMTSGPSSDASETIRVNPTDHNYVVNLHTDQVPVISGCTYRIHVLVGSTELGFADVELFLTQKAAKNITTSETLALVDGKTLPVKFWIAGGALCRPGADCGQGTAYPDRDNTIVSQNLQAGVFIPTGAVPVGTTIIVESKDHNPDQPCFPGLLGQTFQGQSGAASNSCYEFRADPPLPGGKFIHPVVVGLCVDLSGVSHDQEPKIQILQFDAGEPDHITPLKNVAAPFLPCDPSAQVIGARRHGILNFAARLIRSIVTPQPLYARSRAMVFDVGAGGQTDGFSTFTWGLVTNMAKNDGDLQTAPAGTAVATPPSVIFHDSTGALVDSVPVTFTVLSGGGSVTGASTKSGRGGVSGVARVGSWTLGSVPGPNVLIANAPPMSTVTPDTQIFMATGTAANLTISSFTRSIPNPTVADDIVFSAVVQNIGSTPAPASNMTLRVGGETFPPVTAVPALNPGQTFTVNRTVNLDAAQGYIAEATADVNHVVAETNETDNNQLMTFVVTALTATITDASGDAVVDSRVTVAPDLVSATATIDQGNLTMQVRFASGTFDQNATHAAIAIDVDQNPATGFAGVDAAHNDATLLGTEYLLEVGSESVGTTATLSTFNGTGFTSQKVGAITYVADGADVVLPLSALGGDRGELNFKVTVQTQIDFPPAGVAYTGIVDYLTDIGSLPGSLVSHPVVIGFVK